VEAEDGGGRVRAGEDGGERGACECVKRRRGREKSGLCEWGEAENEGGSEMVCAKICSSTSRLEQSWDELWGGTNALTRLSFPVYIFSNKLILRAHQSCN